VAWGTYNVPLGRFGSTDLSLLYRFDSPLTYSLAAESVPLSAIQEDLLAPYASGPSDQTLYFAKRGSEEFAATNLFDFGLQYEVPVFKTFRPWLKLDVFNIFNNDTLVSWDTTINADESGPVDSMGLPTRYTPGPLFGQGTSNADYPRARGWQVSLGFRF
jgi:hypothetical protein